MRSGLARAVNWQWRMTRKSAETPLRKRHLSVFRRFERARSWARRHARLWARSHHVALIMLETAAGVVIVAGLALGVFFWQLSKGDISVGFLTAPIERAVSARLTGYSVSIDDTVLERTGSGAGISVRLKRLRLFEGGNVVAEAPKAEIGVALLPLLTGRVEPSRVDLIGPRVAIVYGVDGRITIELDAPESAGGDPVGAAKADRRGNNSPPATAEAPADAPAESGAGRNVAFLKALLSGDVAGGFGTLDSLGIRGATAVFVHERLNRRWEVSDGDFVLTRRDGALHLSIEAGIGQGGRPVVMSASATLRQTADGIELVGSVKDFVPQMLSQGIDLLGPLALLDLPVMAEFSGRFRDDGLLAGGSFTALLGAGYIRPPGGGSDIFIDEAAVRLKYDAAARRVTVEPSEIYSGRTHVRLSGSLQGPPLAPPPPGGAVSDVWRYAIEARDSTLGSADLSEKPIRVERMGATGDIDLASGLLHIERAELTAQEATVTLSGLVRPTGTSPELVLSGKFLPISVRALKAIWPTPLAPGARRWVTRHFRAGSLTGGSFEARFPPGLLAEMDQGRPIPDRALQLDFGFTGITTSYLDEMPYIRDGEGSARILGNRFELTIDSGRVDIPGGGPLAVNSGSFSIAEIAADRPQGTIKIDFGGKVGDIVALLDHEPLGYPRRAGIGRDDFNGHGEVSLRLDLPLVDEVMLDDVVITAEAEVNRFAGKGAFGGRDIADGVMLINVRDRIISASGEVLVGKQPALIVWRRPFDPTPADPSRLLVRMTLDDAGRRAFGLDFPYVTGPVRFEFEPDGGLGDKGEGRTRVAADLQHAAVPSTPFGWSKPAGTPASASFDVSEIPGKGLALDSFALDGDGVKVRGRIVVGRNGEVETIRLPTFRFEPGDEMNLSADRTGPRKLHVQMSGKSFDARALLSGLVRLNDAAPRTVADEGGEKAAGGGDQIVVDADIARVSGHNGVHLSDVRASIVTVDDTVTRMDVAGRLGGGAALRAVIAPGSTGRERSMRIDSGDAGATFRFSGFYPRAEGGTLVLLATLPEDESGDTTGLLKVSDFRIRSDPVLDTISEAAARGTNVRPAAGSYTPFDRLRVPFTKRPGMVHLSDSILRGPTLGATISGTIDFNRQNVALQGTFIPAYVLNNLIARVPVIGQVLAGGEDQGLVGINYTITGATGDPRVMINPLSVATPGIFRRIFEIGQPPRFAGPDGQAQDSTGALPGPINPAR